MLLKEMLEKTVSLRGGISSPCPLREKVFHLREFVSAIQTFEHSNIQTLPKLPCLLRKEVIQPLVPQRLPCYDFIPITTHTLGGQMPDFGCRRLS